MTVRANDKFSRYTSDLLSPAEHAVAVTPSDTDELLEVSRALYVGGAGSLAVVMSGGGSPVTFAGVPAGAILPLRVRQVLATGTTATEILALS